MRLEAGLVGSFQCTFTMHLEDATGREPAEEGLANLPCIDSRLARQGQGLGHDDERAADHHLIAELAELARARLADANNLLRIPHCVEQRLDRRERLEIPANHD